MPAFLRISENVRNIRVTKFKEIIIKSLAKVEIRERNEYQVQDKCKYKSTRIHAVESLKVKHI